MKYRLLPAADNAISALYNRSVLSLSVIIVIIAIPLLLASCILLTGHSLSETPAFSIAAIEEVSGQNYIYPTNSSGSWQLYYNPLRYSSFCIVISSSSSDVKNATGSSAFGDTPVDNTPGTTDRTFELVYTIEPGSSPVMQITVTVYFMSGRYSTRTIAVIPDDTPPVGYGIAVPAVVQSENYTVYADLLYATDQSGFSAILLDEVSSYTATPSTNRTRMAGNISLGVHIYAIQVIDNVGNAGEVIYRNVSVIPSTGNPMVRLASISAFPDVGQIYTINSSSNCTLYYSPRTDFNLSFYLSLEGTSANATAYGSEAFGQTPVDAVRKPLPYSFNLSYTISKGWLYTGILNLSVKVINTYYSVFVSIIADNTPPSFRLDAPKVSYGEDYEVRIIETSDGSGSGIRAILLDEIPAETRNSSPVTLQPSTPRALLTGNTRPGIHRYAGIVLDNVGNPSDVMITDVVVDLDDPVVVINSFSIAGANLTPLNTPSAGAPGIAASAREGAYVVFLNHTTMQSYISERNTLELSISLSWNDSSTVIESVEIAGGFWELFSCYYNKSGSKSGSWEGRLTISQETIGKPFNDLYINATDIAGRTGGIRIAFLNDTIPPRNSTIKINTSRQGSPVFSLTAGSGDESGIYAFGIYFSSSGEGQYSNWKQIGMFALSDDLFTYEEGLQISFAAEDGTYIARVFDFCGNSGWSVYPVIFKNPSGASRSMAAIILVLAAVLVIVLLGAAAYFFYTKSYGRTYSKKQYFVFAPTTLGLRKTNLAESKHRADENTLAGVESKPVSETEVAVRGSSSADTPSLSISTSSDSQMSSGAFPDSHASTSFFQHPSQPFITTQHSPSQHPYSTSEQDSMVVQSPAPLDSAPTAPAKFPVIQSEGERDEMLMKYQPAEERMQPPSKEDSAEIKEAVEKMMVISQADLRWRRIASMTGPEPTQVEMISKTNKSPDDNTGETAPATVPATIPAPAPVPAPAATPLPALSTKLTTPPSSHSPPEEEIVKEKKGKKTSPITKEIEKEGEKAEEKERRKTEIRVIPQPEELSEKEIKDRNVADYVARKFEDKYTYEGPPVPSDEKSYEKDEAEPLIPPSSTRRPNIVIKSYVQKPVKTQEMEPGRRQSFSRENKT